MSAPTSPSRSTRARRRSRSRRPKPIAGPRSRRRFAGRYPVDPFGLDPQLADLVAPGVRGRGPRATSRAASTCPRRGPAVHRLEPRLRRRRTRRARRRGAARDRPAAPRRRRARSLPFLGTVDAPPRCDLEQRARCRGRAARRSPRRHPARADVAAHRRGRRAARGRARAHARADRPRGRAPGRPLRQRRRVVGGHASGRWSRCADPYDPDDPLAAARFTDAMRRAGRRSARLEPRSTGNLASCRRRSPTTARGSRTARGAAATVRRCS